MRFTCISAGLVALASLLPAQTISTPPLPTGPSGPSSPAPAFPELQQYLNLTASQVTSLQTIVEQRSMAQQQVSNQIGQENQTLQILLASANPNPTMVGQTMIDIQNLEKQLTPSTEPYHTEALAVLTQSQTALLANLNTALLLQTPACEAVNVNLLSTQSSSSVSGTASAVTTVVGCPTYVGIVPVPSPGGFITSLPGGVAAPLPPAGQ